jgi:ABC-type Fe3+-hydroxamate transport system substrate-binding protein
MNLSWKRTRLLSQNVPMPRACFLLLLAVAFCGCGPKEYPFGGKPQRAPRAVVSLSPSTTEILALDGNSGQLKGRTSSCNYPAYMVTIPVYGGVKPDYEKLAADKQMKVVDLVVYDRSLYSDADIAKLKEIGIPTFEFHATNLDDFVIALRELSNAVDAPINISQYIDKITAERSAAKATWPSQKPKVAIISGSLIAGTKSFQASVAEAAGGTPVGPDADRFVPINPETLIQSDPQMILLAVDISPFSKDKAKQQQVAQAAVDAISNDPRYKALSAVKNHAVFPLDADVLLRDGYRVDKLINAVASQVRSVSK